MFTKKNESSPVPCVVALEHPEPGVLRLALLTGSGLWGVGGTHVALLLLLLPPPVRQAFLGDGQDTVRRLMS